MQNRRNILLLLVLIIVLVLIATVVVLNPQSSTINLADEAGDTLSCLTDDSGNCLLMPGVSGLDINLQEVNFPGQFETDYHLVVMPFDREQQVLAVTWLPLFQELVNDNDNLQLWNIAALPELDAGVRLFVLGGISAAITDATIRPQITVLFLEDQELFLEALAIEDIEQIQIFILDKDGVVYYRESGEYTPEKGQLFTEMLQQILN